MGISQVVTLNPNDQFISFLNGASVSNLEIINNSQTKNIVFEVKTTQPQDFFVRPRIGVIDPNGRIKVEII